jgi:thioredoxin-like negative regulator of GroEL
MIERLLAAQQALGAGDLDLAERLFGQVAAADPRNAIAVVGLAEVARQHGNAAEASMLLERALAIDPDDEAAKRLRGAFTPAPPAAAGGTPRSSSRPASSRSLVGWLKRVLGLSPRRTP